VTGDLAGAAAGHRQRDRRGRAAHRTRFTPAPYVGSAPARHPSPVRPAP
jgi:hypothetical protein